MKKRHGQTHLQFDSTFTNVLIIQASHLNEFQNCLSTTFMVLIFLRDSHSRGLNCDQPTVAFQRKCPPYLVSWWWCWVRLLNYSNLCKASRRLILKLSQEAAHFFSKNGSKIFLCLICEIEASCNLSSTLTFKIWNSKFKWTQL